MCIPKYSTAMRNKERSLFFFNQIDSDKRSLLSFLLKGWPKRNKRKSESVRVGRKPDSFWPGDIQGNWTNTRQQNTEIFTAQESIPTQQLSTGKVVGEGIIHKQLSKDMRPLSFFSKNHMEWYYSIKRIFWNMWAIEKDVSTFKRMFLTA